MKNKHSSIDGFISRRPNSRIGEHHQPVRKRTIQPASSGKLLHSNGRGMALELNSGQNKTERQFGYSDIDESLRNINDKPDSNKKLSRRQKKRLNKRSKKPRSRARKIIRFIIILIILALLGVGGFAAYKVIRAGGHVLQGNILDVFKNQPLKQDSNGRSNFLILGTSEDDQGHDGANLTDSMLVVSLDQNNKNIYMFSVPRDLYVKYGQACPSGYAGKINAYFSCSDDGTDASAEQNRLARTQALVGDIFGIDIQYGVHVNHTVIKQAVDAVGGVDVDIQGSNGDSGILDRNFDWRCNYKCYLVKYENGVHHLDGEHALFLAMARGDIAPTYGLSNSNFDREKNQQKILMALKEKATSTGTLTNLSAITKLIDALGDNLRTNVQTAEIRTITDVVSNVKTVDIHTLSLFGQDDAVVTTGSYGGASVVMPAAGIFDYGEIKSFVAKNLSNDPIAKEAAPIVVLNGTGQSGYGQSKANELIEAGYTVSEVDNAPDGTYSAVEIYQIGANSSGTAKKLAAKYNVKLKTTAPPIQVAANIQYVIIFGTVSKE